VPILVTTPYTVLCSYSANNVVHSKTNPWSSNCSVDCNDGQCCYKFTV